MSIPNYPSFHVHPQSLDSGSTPEAFAEREVELGTGAITCTDHGTLAANRKIYDLAKTNSLTPILGLEAYLRDDDCPILTAAGVQKDERGTLSSYAKYFHITLHFLDYEAYLCGVRLLSKADLRAEKHGSERKPLFTWADLEELGGYNVTFGSGCLIGAVSRHLLDHNNVQNAIKYYEKLRGLAKPGCYYVEQFPHDCSKNWVEGTFLEVKQNDGTVRSHKWHAKKWLKTNAGEIQAKDLARAFQTERNEHLVLLGVKNYHTWEELNPATIESAEYKEGFLPNECRDWAPSGDVQAGINKFLKGLAKRYGDPCLVSDDSHYAHSEDKIVQDVRLAQSGNWRFFGDYSRQSSEQSYEYFKTRMGIPEKEFEGWVNNNLEWASRFKDFKFETKVSLPTKFYEPFYNEYAWSKNEKIPARDHSLMYVMELIKKHGRMRWKDEARQERLKTELKLLHENGTLDLIPYWFPMEEVVDFYSQQGLLTGPGRGSAAGVYLTYLLNVTHADPIKWDLSLDRFATLDRIQSGKLPDIDQDLPHREILMDPETGWLKRRFGDHYAQVSVDSTLKLKMAIKDVARFKLGKVPPDIEELTKKLQMPPQNVSDYDFALGYETPEGVQMPGSIETDQALQEYVKRYGDHWEIVKECLGLPRQKGRHACAVVLANSPIHEFIPLTTVSDVRVTSYTANSVEAVGGLKMDFLVVNSLNDVGDAIKSIQARSGLDIPKSTTIDGLKVPGHRLVPFKGQLVDIWDLPEDQAVFEDVALGKTETVFQFNTSGAVKWLKNFNSRKPSGNYAIDSIEAMSAFTALDRPGPLDMFVRDPEDSSGEKRHNLLVEYARRARGARPSPDILPVFDDLVPETYGVMVYQEQLQKIYQVLTGCSGSEAEEFRTDVAKKRPKKLEKAKGPFIEKATARLGEENARAAWEFFITWGQYGFNRSHSICYSIIGYACAFLKHHYPLEWWTSVLKNASKNEVNEKFWQHCGQMIDLPDVKLSGPTFEIKDGRIRAPLSLLQGVGETAHNQLNKYAPYTDINDFVDKIQKHREENKYFVRKVPQENGKSKWVKCDPPAADSTETTATRLGHNALHRGIVYTLILSGAMDSLFAEGSLIHDKLLEYEKALARVAGKKKPAPIDESLVNLSPIARFQRRKAILPAYGEDLTQLLIDIKSPAIQGEADDPFFTFNNFRGEEEAVRFARYRDIQEAELTDMAPGERRVAAVSAYVESSRFFRYGDENREACEVVLDVEGGRFQMVRWGGKAKKIPPVFKQELAGSVVICVINKYKQDRPFSIDDLFVVEPPLPIKKSKEDEVSDE